MNEKTLINAKEIMRKSYARIAERKMSRKLIVITTPHIENDILRKKRRTQSK